MDEVELRKKIFKYIHILIESRKKNDKFISGITKVNYAGRIYDENEIINLFDASLDFWLTYGRYSKEFEKEFSSFLSSKYCILTNSGSSANLLAISALMSKKLGLKRLKPGDEVITLACGFPTTLNPILQNNLTPVFVDIELGYYNISIKDLEKAVSKNTKAIFIPHTLGNPANLNEIIKIVKKYNLWFIEDNCDALGSKYNGKYTGTFGHMSTFSFYPSHHITMGEGGALVTDDDELRKIIISFRDWGRDCWCETGHDNTCGKRFMQKLGMLPYGYDHKYIYSNIGYNLKLTDMQAAIGVAQLKKLPSFIEARKKNFMFLYNFLREFDNYFSLPKWESSSDPCWFGFPIFINENAPFCREKIVKYLETNKIATRMLFGGNLIKQPAYKDIRYKKIGNLKNSNLIMKNLFWIGVYPGISIKVMNYMKKILKNFLKSYSSL